MIDFKTNTEDFVIRVRPSLDEEKNWTGEIDVVIVTNPRNPLGDDDYYQILHICKMISSVIPIMETDEKMRMKVNNYVVNNLDKEEKEDIVKEYKDNVIKINFKPQTRH